MRFERVLVEGFGPLAGFEAVFEPRRLNLIIGPNESGKSSFAAAICATLFGFSSHEEEQRARPWSKAPHRATIVLEASGQRYRMRRDFTTHEVHVERLAPKGDVAESTLFQGTANPRGRGPELEQYETLLRTWFGFADARLFRESCFVHENALVTKISPELRHLISGAVEADYQEIQNALMERLEALTRDHPDPRKQKRADRSIEKRMANLELLRGRLARSEYVLRELKSNVQQALTWLRAQEHPQLATAINRMFQVQLVQSPHQGQVLLRLRAALVIVTAAAQFQQLALMPDADLRIRTDQFLQAY